VCGSLIDPHPLNRFCSNSCQLNTRYERVDAGDEARKRDRRGTWPTHRLELGDFVRHAQRYGLEGVLEAAADVLSVDEYRKLLSLLAAGAALSGVVRCQTPGCLVAFVVSRNGQRYHDAACRQRAKRIRTGQPVSARTSP
jgi:hypothetical protein